MTLESVLVNPISQDFIFILGYLKQRYEIDQEEDISFLNEFHRGRLFALADSATRLYFYYIQIDYNI